MAIKLLWIIYFSFAPIRLSAGLAELMLTNIRAHTVCYANEKPLSTQIES